MPYTMRKVGSQYCVFNKDTGDKKGCSDTQEKAKAYMRALYANSKDEKQKDYHPDVYILNGMIYSLDSMVSSCQSLVVSAEHEELKAMGEHQIDTLTDLLVQLITWRAEWYGDEESLKEKAVKVKNTVLEALGFGSIGDDTELSPDRMVFIKQIVDGRERLRVLMRGTNQFKDRHKEIITEAAHKDYEQWVQDTGRFPEFWIWHLKGSRWGQADFVGYSDGFLTVSGLVDEGKEELAQTMAELDLGVSHGFIALKSQDGGVIEAYRSFEFSVLPRDAAANVWTAMKIAKEASLPLSENQFKVLTEDLKIPTEVVRGWEQENKGFGDALRASVEFKEQNPETPVAPQTEPVVTTTTPVVEPVAGAVTLEAIGALIDAKLDGIKGELAEVKQKQAEQSMDFTAKVNQVFDGVPRGLPLGYQATKANDNLTGTEAAKETEDWFMDPSNTLIALPNGRMA